MLLGRTGPDPQPSVLFRTPMSSLASASNSPFLALVDVGEANVRKLLLVKDLR